MFGQWVAYGLYYGPSDNSLDGDGVGRTENQLFVALCFLSGGVNDTSFLLVNLPCFHLIS